MANTNFSLVPSSRNVFIAFAILYVVWGSTYLAIKIAIDTMPALMMGSVRFLIAGTGLYCFLLAKERVQPTLKQWCSAAVIGLMLLAVGNGGVILAEKSIPTGMASLLGAVTPMLIALMESFPRFDLDKRKFAGLAIGTLGIACLVGPAEIFVSGNSTMQGVLLLLMACVSWSVGSIYSRSAERPQSTLLFVAMQMICGGLALGAVSLGLGEHLNFNPLLVSGQSVLALLYLIVFGSLLGYGAYVWLLQHVNATRVSTYAYVNPIVAVLLGWGFAGEVLGMQTLFSGLAILVAVWLINSKSPRKMLAKTMMLEACAKPERCTHCAAEA